MSYGVGHRCGLDPTLLWLWSRPVAVAPIGPLACKPPYATGAALKKTKKNVYMYIYIYLKTVLITENKKNLQLQLFQRTFYKC